MGVIKVAIADDHKIFRKGVILSLRAYSNIKFVQEAENGQELLDGLAVSQPDVILMDLRMPLKDGIETTKSIAKLYPQIHIIALTMYEDERFVSHMMEIGANGYLVVCLRHILLKKYFSLQHFQPTLDILQTQTDITLTQFFKICLC